MSDSQIFISFCVICAVVVLVMRAASFGKRSIEAAKLRSSTIRSHLIVADAEAYDAQREMLMAMIASTLGFRREELKADTHFQNDLRVPPGELDSLLGQIQERFRIAIDGPAIKTVGDLLDLIRLPAEG